MSDLRIKPNTDNGDLPLPSFKYYCFCVLGEDLYKKVMSNPMPLSYDGQVSITKLYADYRALIGKPFSSNVTE